VVDVSEVAKYLRVNVLQAPIELHRNTPNGESIEQISALIDNFTTLSLVAAQQNLDEEEEIPMAEVVSEPQIQNRELRALNTIFEQIREELYGINAEWQPPKSNQTGADWRM
jgi:hypothetical protein